jgi:hypothetical protein
LNIICILNQFIGQGINALQIPQLGFQKAQVVDILGFVDEIVIGHRKDYIGKYPNVQVK